MMQRDKCKLNSSDSGELLATGQMRYSNGTPHSLDCRAEIYSHATNMYVSCIIHSYKSQWIPASSVGANGWGDCGAVSLV